MVVRCLASIIICVVSYLFSQVEPAQPQMEQLTQKRVAHYEYETGEIKSILEIMIKDGQVKVGEIVYRNTQFIMQTVPVPSDGGTPSPRRTICTFPDIPTHNVLGGPTIARSAGVVAAPESGHLFVILSKHLGSRAIIRIYQLSLDLKSGAVLPCKESDDYIVQHEITGVALPRGSEGIRVALNNANDIALTLAAADVREPIRLLTCKLNEKRCVNVDPE